MCEWMEGDRSAPVNAGQEVNTLLNEMFPCEYFDSTLHFASDRCPSLGGLDLFFCRTF